MAGVKGRFDPVRGPLLSVALLLAAGGLALHYMPLSAGRVLLFDMLRLHLWWPLCLAPLAVLLARRATQRFCRVGLPQRLPLEITGLAALIVACVGVLATDTAAEWPVYGAPIVLAALGWVGWRLAWSWLGYTEAWRKLAHDAVTAEIEAELEDGTFRKLVEADPEGQTWGSAHCLAVVQDKYERLKHAAAADLPAVNEIKLEQYLAVGEQLLDYLALPWHESILTKAEQAARKTEAQREMITLALLAGRPAETPRMNPGQTARLAGRSAAWRKHQFAADGDAYRGFLAGVFDLCRETGRESAPEAVGAAVTRLLNLFHSLPPDTPPARIATCACTWLALAHYRLPGQAVFDSWLALRGGHEQQLWVKFDAGPDATDPALVAARLYLAKWYKEWSQTVHPDWCSGLLGRAEYARQLADGSSK
jgi:hypothetical protein